MRQAVFWSSFTTNANISTPAIVNRYLEQHGYPGPLIKESPIPDLSVVVVIPAYHETDLIQVLFDLIQCEVTTGSTEVIVVINHPEGASPEIIKINEMAFRETSDWAKQYSSPHLGFQVLYQPDLPRKKAGVGLARKIGMDEAARRFALLNSAEGVIVCLDADCGVQKNYLAEIERFFHQHPEVEGCAIYFEHPWQNLDRARRNAIVDYELHLRYFIGMQRRSGFPFAYQTVGSSMAVRAGVYCKVGGMNTRQAGEDFYFLHKIIERGAFGEIHSTTVYPSPRTSDRVPFGTGRAMLTFEQNKEPIETYNPLTFHDLKAFLDVVSLFRQASMQNVSFLLRTFLPTSIRTFLVANGFEQKLTEINQHTATAASFQKRFFHWFNAFLLMKFMHFARDNFYGSIPVGEACAELFKAINLDISETQTHEELLIRLREYHREKLA